MSCMTILFSMLANHPIRPKVKRAVSLLMADGHLSLPQGFVWVCTGMG